MYCVTLLVMALTIVSADDNNMECIKLHYPPTMHCCKNNIRALPSSDMDKDGLKECFKIPRGRHSCQHDICIGKKRGYASDDGTVDMDAWEKMITEDFKASPSLIEAIKENCIKGDISKYGSSDDCQLVKLKHCTYRAAVLDCKEWDEGGPCTGIKDLVKECTKMDE